MSVEEILAIISNNKGWCIIILMSLIEVSKIKINPWSALFRWIGGIFMSGVRSDISKLNAKMEKVAKELDELKEENRENEAKTARTRILRCSDEVYQGFKHSKEYFDNILSDITYYKQYCADHPEFRNEMTVIATQRIEDVYKRCLEKHEFL